MPRQPKKQQAEAPALEPINFNTGELRMCAIKTLAVSALNVRKDATADDDLIASIAAHGLLQPLIGYPFADRDAAETLGLDLAICAGQRRLLALQKLVERGQLSDEAMVPVRIVDEDTAIEISLAENLERKSMSPVDEFKAFDALIKTGRYNEQLIADRFGYSRRQVTERLRLANLHPDVLAALEKGEFGIDAAKCFCTLNDQEQQLKVYKQAARSNYDKFSKSQILSIISGIGIDVSSKVGQFMGGAKAYEKAGGTFEVSPMDDLFADTYAKKRPQAMTDPAIVKKLWDDAVAKATPKIVADAAKALEIDKSKVTVVWADPKGKAGKITNAFKLEYSDYYYGGIKKQERDEILAKCIEKGGVVYVRAYIDQWNGLTFGTREIYVSQDVKFVYDEHQKAKQSAADKDRAKEQKLRDEQPIYIEAALRFWYSLTPEQKIERLKIDRRWAEKPHTKDGFVRFELNGYVSGEELKPFVKQVKDDFAAKAKAEEEAAAAAKAENAKAIEAFVMSVNEFAKIQPEALPGYIVLNTDQGEVTAQKKENGDFDLFSPDGEDWEAEPSLAKEQLLDFARSIQDDPMATLKWWTDYGAFEAETIHGDTIEVPLDDTTALVVEVEPEPQLETAE